AMDVWLSTSRDRHGKEVVNGFVVSAVTIDQFDGTQYLLIYSVHAWASASDLAYMSALETLKRHARSRGCSKIVGYTKDSRIIELIKALGGGTDYVVITVEVGDEVDKL
ncbi:hypothetical protein LCGC14_2800370, partial [marine sediment metagenome]